MAKNKRAIVLDLDETLVHSVITKKPNLKLKNTSDFNFQINGDKYYVFKRPGLDAFLAYIFKNFDYIGFWTTGMALYAKHILKHILTLPQAQRNKLVFIYTRNKCARDSMGYYKPLTNIWKFSNKFTPQNTIMIDNTPIVMKKNPQNGIVCPNYDINNLSTDRYLPWLQNNMNTYLTNNTVPPLQFVRIINGNTR